MGNVGYKIGYSMLEWDMVGKGVSMGRLCYHML